MTLFSGFGAIEEKRMNDISDLDEDFSATEDEFDDEYENQDIDSSPKETEGEKNNAESPSEPKVAVKTSEVKELKDVILEVKGLLQVLVNNQSKYSPSSNSSPCTSNSSSGSDCTPKRLPNKVIPKGLRVSCENANKHNEK